jgi:riboflavin kinase / FMN adenylyltransferase
MAAAPPTPPGPIGPSVYRELWQDRQQPGPPPGAVIAMGTFDGVHVGHQQVLFRASALAAEVKGAVAALTFDPHPAKVLAPDLAPALITTVQRRIALLGEAGAGHVIVLPFSPELAAVTAEDFVTGLLVDRLRVGGVVVGYDFTFGRGGRGSSTLLREMAATCGFAVSVVEPYHHEGILVSSTKIREFVLSGRVYGAATLLGRPFELSGPVVRGAGRGRQLGFPTANVAVREELLPAKGVYAARARLDHGEVVEAAVSIGTNPTFTEGNELVVEAFLLDFDADLYDRTLVLELVRRLRPERRFTDAEALIQQMTHDVRQTREILLTL